MYESTFEGGELALLNTSSPTETPYDKHLREATATYDAWLTQTYREVDE